MATIFKLIIEDDEGKTTVYPLAESELLIGRKEGNTIRLMERNISRRHARFIRKNGSVFIEDLDSYNGVRINGERINGRYEVKEGDLVEIGDFHLALQAASLEDSDETEAELVPTSRPGDARRGASEESSSSAWPAVGTVPDFRLPAELLAAAERTSESSSPTELRNTLVDRTGPPTATEPALAMASLATPARQGPGLTAPGARALPPFPTPAGSILSSSGPPGFGLGPSLGGPPSGSSTSKARGLAALDAQRGAREDASDKEAALNVGPPRKVDQDVPARTTVARVSSVPRLICVSTSYAGQSFPLTKNEMVIGRVDDNDIVIEHRSVSRSHAKILFDGRTHKVIDLQSANGILVNNEEYAMTDLRARDLIELGHVRFRFLPPDEPFIPTSEELEELHSAGYDVERHGEISSHAPTAVPGAPPGSSPGGSLFPSPDASPGAPAGNDAARAAGGGFSHDQDGEHGRSPAELDAPPVPPQHDHSPPSYDPSMVATVTDTPLSVLGHVDAAVPVAVTRPSAGAPRVDAPDTGAVVQDRSPQDRASRMDEVVRPGAGSRARSTDVPNSSMTAASASLQAKPRGGLGARGRRAATSSRSLVYAAAGAGLILVLAAVVIVVLRPTEEARLEQRIRALYDQRQFDQVVKLCAARRAALSVEAAHLCGRADAVVNPARINLNADPESDSKEPRVRERSGIARREGAEARRGLADTEEMGTEVPTADAAAIELEPEEPIEVSRGVRANEDETQPATADRTRRGAPSRRAPPLRRAQERATQGQRDRAELERVGQLYEDGMRLFLSGEMGKAERRFVDCLGLDSTFADCHRGLGAVYRQRGQSAKAVTSFKRYLEVAPGASDVGQVRDAIRALESE